MKTESVKTMNKVTPIDSEMLARFEQGYEARPALQVMSNAISRTALPDAAFVPAAAAKLQMDFSVLVKTNNITNQKQSGRCWMFSTLNVLRQRVIAKCQHEISRGLIYIISLFFEIEQHHSNNSNRLKIPDYSHSARNTSFP